MYDIVILGGGPAGSEALFRLAKSGFQTILIDKRNKGEGKPCGGAILQEEFELFGELPSDVYDFPFSNTILRTHDSEDIVLSAADSKVSGYGVKREIYDTYLMERAQNAGGKIRFRERVININRDHGNINIETDRSNYRSRFVFVALGWRGLSFCRKLGLPKYPYKKADVAVQKILNGEHFEEPNTLYFHYLPDLIGGYFWVFPKKGTTYVGCAVNKEYLRGKNLVSILDAFLDRQFGTPKVLRQEGALIPTHLAGNFCHNGIFFLGDSAGLANPLHGGGIFEARLSAKLAAEAVENFLTGKTEDPGTEYSRSIEKKIIDKTHCWDAIIRRAFISPTSMEKLWSLSKQDPQFKDAINILYSYSTDHFRAFKLIIEKVFQKLQQEMEAAIRSYQNRINRELGSLFVQDTELEWLINYSLLGSGKRLRSSLVCLMCEALGVEVERALPTALSYELAHTASLVHDDIIDEAYSRRGKPSVVAGYGLDAAIVSGDALIMKAYEIGISGYRQDRLPKEDLIALVECATHSGIKTCRGELLDVKIGKKPERYSVADYIRLVEQKTASLIEGPCEAAAILAGQENMRSTTRLFGRYMGIAFQILDDAKDIFASEDVSLKGRFTDFRSGKPNLYIIFMLQKAQNKDRAKLEKLLARKKFQEESIKELFQLCELTGALNSVKQIFGAYLRKAEKVLDKLRDSEAKTKLRNLIDAMGYWKYF